MDNFSPEITARLNEISEQTGIPAEDIVEFAVAELVNECSAEDIADMIGSEQ